MRYRHDEASQPRRTLLAAVRRCNTFDASEFSPVLTLTLTLTLTPTLTLTLTLTFR